LEINKHWPQHAINAISPALRTLNVVLLMKIINGLKHLCSEMPNGTYSQRLPAMLKT